MQKTDKSFIQQLNKLRRDKKFLWLGVLSFVLVTFWILLSIFATTKTSSISPELQTLAKSFVPRLESKVFDDILLKRPFSQEELANFPIYILNKKDIEGEVKLIDITKANLDVTDESLTSEEQKQAEPTPIATATPTIVQATSSKMLNLDELPETIEATGSSQN